jgi:hypothetical protein
MDEVVMIVLAPAPVTAMGLSLRAGFDCCSTEAKKASISTQRMISDIMMNYYTIKRSGTAEDIMQGLYSKFFSQTTSGCLPKKLILREER